MRSGSRKIVLVIAISLSLLGLLLPSTAAQTGGGVQWKSIGPAGIGILALVPHPAIPHTLYVVVYAHGVHRSTDSGETWQVKNRGMERARVLSLAIAEEAGKVLYAGTASGGVFNSTDGGETWESGGGTVQARPEGSKVASELLFVQSLAAVNDMVVYAGTGNEGIYRSEDGGESWYPLREGLPLGLDVRTILLDLCHEGILYIGTSRGVFKSEDNGASWRQRTTFLTHVLAFADSGNTIYAGSSKGLFRSEDAGEHWDVVRQAQPDGFLEVRALLVDDTTLYVGTIGGLYTTSNGRNWVSRNGDLPLDSLVVTGIARLGDQLYLGTGSGIFRSEDDGVTWVQLSHGLPEIGLIVKGVTFGADGTERGNGLVINTWGAGIYKSLDKGATWSKADRGLVAPYIAALTVSDGVSYAGTSRAIYISRDGGETWSFSEGPASVQRLVVSESNSREIYACIGGWEQDLDGRWQRQDTLIKSYDGGSTWQPVESVNVYDVSDVLVNPENNQLVYIATRGDGVYQSTDGGKQWKEFSQGLSIGNIHLLASGREAGDILFAGTATGIYRRDQDGIWEQTILGTYDTIAIDPSHPNRVYAANSDGAFIFSSDYGKTWKSAGFTEFGINELAIDPRNSNFIYAATEGGSVLRGNITGLFPSRLNLTILVVGLVGSGLGIILVAVVIGISLRHYPAYAGGWAVAKDYPLQQIIPLVAPLGKVFDREKLIPGLRAIEAFSTREQVQYALDGLVEAGLMQREEEGYRFVFPWTARVHRWVHSEHILPLAERVRTQHPLYTRTRGFFTQARFRIEELGAEEFLLTPQSQDHPQVGYGPMYARLITGRPSRGKDFTDVCDASRQHYGVDLSHRVALVISDQRPEPGARYRLYEIRERERLAIVPLDSALFGQIKPNRSANDILASEIDQATGQQNLYAISGPVSSDLSFFGRERVLQDIIDLLNAGQPVGVFGLRKVGKTSLVQRLQGRLAQRRPIAFVDAQATVRQQGVWPICPVIVAAFADHLERTRPDLTLPDLRLYAEPGPLSSATAEFFLQDLRALHAALGQPDEKERLLLIVDEVDRLLPAGRTPGYAGFAAFFGQLRAANQQAHILDVLVIGVDPAINRRERWQDHDNELYRALREVWMPSMALQDVREMIESLGSQIGVRYEPEALQLLAGAGGGHPFVTRQLCSLAVEGRLGRGVITVTADQAQAAIEDFVFQDPYLPEMWRTRLDAAQREMLRALAHASAPIPRARLLPPARRQAALAALGALEETTLIRRDEAGYIIGWGVFRDWIRWVELGLEN